MNNEIFQRQYDFEMTRKNSLSSSVNVPIVALTVLGGAASTMILKNEYSLSFSAYIFIAAVSIAIFFGAYALVLVFRSQIGYWHHKIPSSSTLSSYYDQLLEWYKTQNDDEEKAQLLAKKEFDGYLNRKLSEASDANGENNLKRGALLHDANVKIALALLFLAVASPFYIYANLAKNDSPSKIQIVNPILLKTQETTMPAEENNNSNRSDAKKTESSQNQPAEKPPEPQNVVFRDNSRDPGSKDSRSKGEK